jgi:hypothetical protein
MIGGNKRPSQQSNQPAYTSAQNNAWQAASTKGGSQQNQRAKFGGSQMQMRDN